MLTSTCTLTGYYTQGPWICAREKYKLCRKWHILQKACEKKRVSTTVGLNQIPMRFEPMNFCTCDIINSSWFGTEALDKYCQDTGQVEDVSC